MLKLITLSRCGMCTQIASQGNQPLTSRTTVFGKAYPPVPDRFEEIKKAIERFALPRMTKNKQLLVKASPENVKTITTLLEKHNVDTSQIKKDKKIFNEVQWTVERRILFLKELGVETINTSQIVNFIPSLYLSVPMYKAYLFIDPDVNLAEKLLSNVNSSKIDSTAMNHLDPNQYTMKMYYYECLSYYVKNHLNLNDKQIKRIFYQKHLPIVYNSFQFLDEIMRLITEKYKLGTKKIMQNYYWLLSHHPDHSKANLNLIKNSYEDLNIKSLVERWPRILNCDTKDLEIFLSKMKEYEITTEMIHSAPSIFHLKSEEFQLRVENVLSNSYTLVYRKHPRFLHLIRDYPHMLPRLKYVQEQNFRFATIHSLTTFHNYLEQLTTTRKLNKQNIMSFFKLEFNDEAEELYLKIKKHPCYQCVPLVQMHETLVYLRKIYSKKAIHNCIYAILYSKLDLETAYKEVMKEPRSKQMSDQHILSFCLYKIEATCHFTGDAVLMPDKYAENLNENVNPEERIEDDVDQGIYQEEKRT